MLQNCTKMKIWLGSDTSYQAMSIDFRNMLAELMNVEPLSFYYSNQPLFGRQRPPDTVSSDYDGSNNWITDKLFILSLLSLWVKFDNSLVHRQNWSLLCGKTKKWGLWVKFDPSIVHRQNWPLLCGKTKKWGLWVKFDASIVHRQNWPLLCGETKKLSLWVKFDASIVHRQNWSLLCTKTQKWSLWF